MEGRLYGVDKGSQQMGLHVTFEPESDRFIDEEHR